MNKWQSDVDRKIREARERGEFDNLPGAGKPIPDLGKTHDELWWVKRLLKREGLSFEPEKLEENVQAFIDRITAMKPQTTKGQYIKGIAISATMTTTTSATTRDSGGRPASSYSREVPRRRRIAVWALSTTNMAATVPTPTANCQDGASG